MQNLSTAHYHDCYTTAILTITITIVIIATTIIITSMIHDDDDYCY